jgi:nicotinate-nucleotide adenylyltransferase
MRTGILGGTFDPPHLAHLEMVRAASVALDLDQVIWVPANKNPLKGRRATAGKLRLEMAQLAAQDHPLSVVSDIEISRGGPSYTVDTLEELLMALPGRTWWVIVGSDSLRTFMDWKNPGRIIDLARIAAISRDRDQVESVKKLLPPEVSRRVDMVPMDRMTLSSSDIRADLAVGKSVEHWLSAPVWEYIRRKGLYQQVKQD